MSATADCASFVLLGALRLVMPELLAIVAPERFGVEFVSGESAPYAQVQPGRDLSLESDDHGFGFGPAFGVLPDYVVDIGQVVDGADGHNQRVIVNYCLLEFVLWVELYNVWSFGG